MIYIDDKINSKIPMIDKHLKINFIESYKTYGKMFAEGLLIITVLIFSLMSLFIWFY